MTGDRVIAAGGTAQVTRNGRCACGSGLRYKQCCGRRATIAPPDRHAATSLLKAAFDAHRHGRLEESRELYLRVLRERPGLLDAEHMLGVVELCEGDFDAALSTLRRVAARQSPPPPEVVHNLAIVVAALHAVILPEATADLWLAYLASESARAPRPAARSERVSVIVPSHNHAAFIGDALDSVLAQTRAADEIVVVDDGSTDGSVVRLHAIAARAGGRIRITARERRGAAAPLEEAIARSTGEWIAILNSDDLYAPGHLGTMVESVAVRGATWGFSRATYIDGEGRPLRPGASVQADRLRVLADGVGAADTVGFSLIASNRATSSGTLFFSRDLHRRVGGFRDLRYTHDWDFCLRASLVDEPVYVPAPTYAYRLHGGNAILAGGDDANREATAMLQAFVRVAESLAAPANRYAPVPAVWGDLFALRVIEAGGAMLLAPGTVERLADACHARLAS
jgi:glycosyltransferase involved in cell wall biosynthesis